MTIEQRTTAAETKYENGDILTPEELALLSPALQAAYADDMAEEAEHQALMEECRALAA